MRVPHSKNQFLAFVGSLVLFFSLHTSVYAVTVGISGDKFTINGTPTFLLGVEYKDASYWHKSDFAGLSARGYKLIRIWLVRIFDGRLGPDPRSFFDASGNLVQKQKLLKIVDYAASKGMIVDVTILNVSIARNMTAFDNAVRQTVAALKDRKNVIYDIMNEHNLDVGITHAQGRALLAAAKNENPNAIVFLSTAPGELLVGETTNQPSTETTVIAANVDAHLNTVQDMVLAPHMNRTSDWSAKTDDRVDALQAYLLRIPAVRPIYLQEEARRGFRGMFPTQQEFLEAALNAKNAGAAAWNFHSDAGRYLDRQTYFQQLDPVDKATLDALPGYIYGIGTYKKGKLNSDSKAGVTDLGVLLSN